MNYRPNVCLLIINQDGKLLMGKRLGPTTIWQCPQGGVEDGDSLEASALREAEEETGAAPTLFEIKGILDSRNQYSFSSPKPYGEVLYHGQNQRYVVLKFLGNDSDIKVAEVSHPEFSHHQWVSLSKALEIADSVRQKAYKIAFKELQDKSGIFQLRLDI